jgi:hypothetical protein
MFENAKATNNTNKRKHNEPKAIKTIYKHADTTRQNNAERRNIYK